MNNEYDFGGWATIPDMLCSDGRVIGKDAFAHQDGEVVPLVWGHIHDDPKRVLGKVTLYSKDGGVYCKGKFNDGENAKMCKMLLVHGDIDSISICANELRPKNSKIVQHGKIREVSLVLSGANPGAHIDEILCHSDEDLDEAIITSGETIELLHSDDEPDDKEEVNVSEILQTLNDQQAKAVEIALGCAVEYGRAEAAKNLIDKDEDKDENIKHDGSDDTLIKEDDNMIKHNAFESVKERQTSGALTVEDSREIIKMAKNSSVGSFRTALQMYVGEDELQHAGFYDAAMPDSGIDVLFPDYKDVLEKPFATVTDRDEWVRIVMDGVHKSPISRIRTREADLRQRVRTPDYWGSTSGSSVDDDGRRNFAGNRGYGWQRDSAQAKHEGGEFPFIQRTTDPQTVYRKDSLFRDDIIDITEFDIVAYQYKLMRAGLEYEIARAILFGDGRLSNDPDKISQDHIRSVYNDVEPYVIRRVFAPNQLLQGTDTTTYFGKNFIVAESMVEEILDAQIDYRGGAPIFFCTQRFINTMLLSRDRDGHRMYKTVADIEAALNIKKLVPCDEIDYIPARTVTVDNTTKKYALTGIGLNLQNYTLGATRGGEITSFNQFDIDFNKEKYLIEARVSGALTRAYSAFILEEDVTP